jgi:hypothetical protein
MGIVYGHAYTILEVVSEAGFQLLKLRNPLSEANTNYLNFKKKRKESETYSFFLLFSLVYGGGTDGALCSGRCGNFPISIVIFNAQIYCI